MIVFGTMISMILILVLMEHFVVGNDYVESSGIEYNR